MKSKVVVAESNRKAYRVNGGKILLFGDLHLSSSFSGKHKNYLYECYETMEKIQNIVSEEKPHAVFFAGDLIGVNERNLKDRQFLMRVVLFFSSLYNITKGNVYAVRGNHDIGDFSDFDFLVGLGYIKTPQYVDYFVNGNKELRFHFVNYGEENMPLHTEDTEFDHVVIGHADYYIEGETNWYGGSKSDRLEVKSLRNFNNVSFIFSGHIHLPSKDVIFSNLPNGEQVGVFYMGSVTRVAEEYDACWYITFRYDEELESSTYDANLIPLTPYKDIYFDNKELINSEEDEESEEEQEKRTEALKEIIGEIFSSKLATGDLFSQIDRLPAAREHCKELAKSYLRLAIDGGGK